MPVAFQAKPDVEEEDTEEEEPEPTRRPVLRGKQPPRTPEEQFERYWPSLRAWLHGQRNHTASGAAIIRHLRTIPGFAAFTRQHPFYNRIAHIVSVRPELEVVSGLRNPRIRLRDDDEGAADLFGG